MITKTNQIERVLLVEQDEDLASEVERVLKAVPIEVHKTKSHFKALTMLEDEYYSLVIVSADGTGISGLEFCRILRKRHTQADSDFIYVLLTGREWQKVHLCEQKPQSHDIIIYPWIECELIWRVETGLNWLKEARRLKRLLYFDPGTGALNNSGVERALQEEVNRLGRKKGWLSVGVFDFHDRDWIELNHGREALTRLKDNVFKFLTKSLRNYDQVGKVNRDRICILSGDCDYECFLGLLNRINMSIKQTDFFLPDGTRFDVVFSGTFKCVLIDAIRGGGEKAFSHIWNWIQDMEQLPKNITGQSSFFDKDGMRSCNCLAKPN